MAKKAIKIQPNNCRVQATFRPDTINEKDRTVEVVFTTGQAGKRYDWGSDSYYMEELEISDQAIVKERLDKGLSVIGDHDRYKGIDGVFGITETYRIENNELVGLVRFSSDEESDIKFTKVKEKILRHCSLGYEVYEYMPVPQAEDKLPLYRAVSWQPNELSFVVVSFETNNGVRSNDDSVNYSEIHIREDNPMNLEQLRAALAAAQNRSAPQAEIDELQRQIDTAVTAAERAAAPVPVPAPAAPAARAAEPVPAPAARAAAPVAPVIDENAIRAAAAAEQRGQLQPMLDACSTAGLTSDFAIRSYGEGVSLDKFRELVIAELGNESSENIIRNNGTVLNSDGRSDQQSQTREAAQSALHYRCGSDIKLDDNVRAFNNMTLFEMARSFVEASGENTLGMSRQKVATRAFHSTSDFPLILENVMNKNLQAAYVETPQTFRDLGRRTTVNDFRDKHTYSLGDAPNLLPLGEHGEYKAGTFSEGKEKYGIATFARKLGFTRQMLINDDMSALDRMPAMFGAAGSRLESDIVWGLLLNYNFFTGAADSITMEDGNPLFHASHGNLLEAGSAFSETALSNLRKLGRKAKTLDGNFMNITYGQLVIPEDIETTVDKILAGTILAHVSGEVNPWRGKLDYRVEPRLGTVSQSAYYAFSRMADTFEYAYLAGEEEMMTEVNTQTDIDGLEIKVRKDFGAGLVDYRAMAKATGAA